MYRIYLFPDHPGGIPEKEEEKIMYKLTYHEFETVLATAKDLVRCTNFLFDVTDALEINADVYARIVILHNAAVDYIEAMKELNKKED